MEKQEYKDTAALAANGDAKAFSHLYETLYRAMYYTAFYSLRSEADAVEAVLGTVKDGFAAVGRLRNENAFRTFMMKSLCARIKLLLKQYSDEDEYESETHDPISSEERVEGLREDFWALPDSERVVTALYAAGRFTAEEIAAYMGMTAGAVRKKLKRGLELFELD